jgi:hypothetical protein
MPGLFQVVETLFELIQAFNSLDNFDCPKLKSKFWRLGTSDIHSAEPCI